jgi:predicted dehydrogenase
MKRRVVIVGLGSIGKRQARLLAERHDVAIEVVEPQADAIASVRDELGPLRAHSSFEEMLETTPDIVWIATPTHMHSQQTVRALAAGANVFCEKPMNTVAEAIAMKEAAAASRGILNVGFYLHFWQGLVRIKQWIVEGSLGTVLHAHARVGSYATLVNSRSRYQMYQRGSLLFDYSHQPDLFYC